ncbi:diacylglycerol kinase delta-like [Etheostoma cragini]|uniref:diacylglycerol kinase delta-like n=1 Tax=Etheostoma cragini TaxID=417921 RepID=UPI00155F4F76|nr:diacylglycerol kinase delta-like [Etheostoma cragini]
MAEAGGPEFTASRCQDESSDSEPEQEPGSPQKLIRKVSTSGQIRSKVWMPHQWLEGNLPVSAKCLVCEKTCGSVLRLQDWRCLWCKAMVHSGCMEQLSSKCPLGLCKVSVIPPTALNSIDSDGFWKASCPPSCTSPLLVFVNSKSGDNQGVKFLRRFKQLLNPAQVFDLMNGGPHLG